MNFRLAGPAVIKQSQRFAEGMFKKYGARIVMIAAWPGKDDTLIDV